MKLTPLDIHHKEFGHSLRGYNEEQVDQFLDEVADEFERLFKENIDLSEKLEAAMAKLNEFELQRHTINNTMMAAQRTSDEMKARAQADGESTVREAEMKAKDIIHAALAKKQQVAGELIRIKQAEEEFRARYKSLLENNLRTVAEIVLPDDIDTLLGGADELAAEIVAKVAPAAVAPAPAPAPEAVEAPARAKQDEEPPAAGFVQSVALGEVAAPDIPGALEFTDPTDFSMPSFDALGEREDDVDIEEID